MVADILLRAYEAGENCKPLGFLDDNPALAGTTILGLPVLGAVDQLHEFDHDTIIVAIGDNRIRYRIFEAARERGERIANAMHPTAVLAPDVCLGRGVMICAGVIVNPATIIGDDVILNTGCTVDHHDQIGSHAHVAPGVHLGGNVHVGEGALVGIGTTVIPGRTIGRWAVVGAGSVVTKDVPPYSTAAGVPARVIRRASRNMKRARGGESQEDGASGAHDL